MWLAYIPYCDTSYSSDQCEIFDLGIMDHRFQVYSSDLTKGGEVAFHHGRRIPEGKILEHLSSQYNFSPSEHKQLYSAHKVHIDCLYEV